MDLRGSQFIAIRKAYFNDRLRVNFTSKQESLEAAAKVEEQLKKHGTERIEVLTQLPNYDGIVNLINTLNQFGKTLEDAVDFYIQHLTDKNEAQESRLINELAIEWINEKKANNINPIRQRTIDTLATYRNIIQNAFGAIRIRQLTKSDIEAWLNSLNKEPRTVHHHLNYLNQFLNWCYKKEYITKIPTVGLSVDVPFHQPDFFTVDQCKIIINQVQGGMFDNLTPYIVLCLFAGIRPQEAEFLTWDNVDANYIRIPADISKTKRERLVPIENNLKTWMDHCRIKYPSSLIPQCNMVDRNKRFHNSLPFEWIHDGLRHTFATFFISKYRDGGYGKLETIMGSSAHVLRKHYVRYVPEIDCDQFWNIQP